MAEKQLIIDQLKFTHEGVFDLHGLYRLMASFFYEQGWDWKEIMNSEQILPSGRHIKIELEPWKSITDYFKMILRIRIHCADVKQVEIEQNGTKVTLLEGKLMMVFDGYILSDRADKWEATPLRWFIRLIFDKYIFKTHYSKAEQWLISATEDLYIRIRKYVNTAHPGERGIISSHAMA